LAGRAAPPAGVEPAGYPLQSGRLSCSGKEPIGVSEKAAARGRRMRKGRKDKLSRPVSARIHG